MSCLYILEIKSLLVTSFANIFSHSIGCHFISLIVSLLTSLVRSPLFLFACFFFFLYWETDLTKHWYDLCEKVSPSKLIEIF